MRERAGEPVRRPGAPLRGDVLRGVAAELEAAGLESPLLEAERLLAHVLGISRSDLVLTARESLDPRAAGALAEAVARRLDHEPLQHIEGSAAFRELVLVSDRRALIPRPETEQLLDRVGDWVGSRAPLERALDIGTGSGAIALALLGEGLAEIVVGLDTSAVALAQAKENAVRSGVAEGRLDLRLCPADIWSALDSEERFDLIVSNPPYVADTEVDRLPEEIRRFEPSTALAGGADGLAVIRIIVDGARAHLVPGAGLFLEIGEGQESAVRALLANTEAFEAISVDADLAGHERFVFARRRTPSDSRG
jgi:release factor glutamine methyltransferase